MSDDIVLQLDHLGIAVDDLAAALRLYRDTLGLKLTGVEEVRDQKIRAHHLKLGEAEIELLESTDPAGPVGRFLARRGPGIHHIALRVGDLDSASTRLQDAGYRALGVPTVGARGNRILFFHPASTGGVLLELCSTP